MTDLERFFLGSYPLITGKYNPRKIEETIAVDIYKDKGSYKVDAALPGFTREEIKIDVNDRVLTISASRGAIKDDLMISEISDVTEYKRMLNLSKSVDTDSISATLDSGILTIKLNLLEAKKSKEIKIK